MSTLKRIPLSNFVGASRHHSCLWETLKMSVNKVLRRVSIAGRNDLIPVALDDDKIWIQSSGRNEEDSFGLRKVTHVRDNRKGII